MKYPKSILSIFLTLCLLLGSLSLPLRASAEEPKHGTADEEITEDMLSNIPPADYRINSDMQKAAKEGAYNRFFPKDRLQTVRISIDDNNLQYILQNAMDKASAMTTSVSIGDETISYAGLRAKGNYTLEHSYTDNIGSDRFSFSLNFGKYIKAKKYGETQNFYGLNKVSFNNFFFDKSMLKEYCALTLFQEMGLPTPQFCLSKLYINDEYYGVYFMVESLDHSILEQYYNTEREKLGDYLSKPKKTRLHYDELCEDMAPLYGNDEDNYKDVHAALPKVMNWVERLNLLSEGKDFDGNEIDVNSEEYVSLLGQIMDVDESLRYFAVHSWLCQMDNMFVVEQNYGLYIDNNGRSLMVPWDYDLSFGCYYPSMAEAMANFDLDMMYRDSDYAAMGKSTRPEKVYPDFPLFHVIFQNESLREQFHSYMMDVSRIAALGGRVECMEKSYDPVYLCEKIETIYEELYAAAAEPLTESCYYMNFIKQPYAVESAKPVLERIIALRAVGVYNRINQIDSLVSGSGCNLELLGNGIAGWTQSNGDLTFVEPATALFARATIRQGRGAQSPGVTIRLLKEEEKDYAETMDYLEGIEADRLYIYNFYAQKAPNEPYKVCLPLAGNTAARCYALKDGTLQGIETEMSGNLCCFELESGNRLIVCLKEQASEEAFPWWLLVLIPFMILIGSLVNKKEK